MLTVTISPALVSALIAGPILQLEGDTYLVGFSAGLTNAKYAGCPVLLQTGRSRRDSQTEMSKILNRQHVIKYVSSFQGNNDVFGESHQYPFNRSKIIMLRPVSLTGIGAMVSSATEPFYSTLRHSFENWLDNLAADGGKKFIEMQIEERILLMLIAKFGKELAERLMKFVNPVIGYIVAEAVSAMMEKDRVGKLASAPHVPGLRGINPFLFTWFNGFLAALTTEIASGADISTAFDSAIDRLDADDQLRIRLQAAVFSPFVPENHGDYLTFKVKYGGSFY